MIKEMKKAILAIGIIALFIGITVIPSCTSTETKLESQNAGPRYSFTAIAMSHYSVYGQGAEEIDEGFFLLAIISGEVSWLGFPFGSYNFKMEDARDYITVKPFFREGKTYTLDSSGSSSNWVMVMAGGVFLIPLWHKEEI